MNQPAPVLKMDGKLAAITTAGEQLADSLEDYKSRFEKLDATKAFPQAAMRAYLRLDEIAKALEKAQDAFKAAAIKHAEAKGKFEDGKIALTVKDLSKITPKWMDEAIENARQAAVSAGITFNKDAYIECVRQKYPPSVSKQVKLVEGL